MIILRLIHFIFGTIWFGGAFYYNFIPLPKLRQMDGHTQGSVITAVTQTMAPLLGISALITILIGGLMIAQLHTEHGTNFLTPGWGMSMMVGLFASILAVVLVFAVEVPTGNKVNKLATSIEGRAPSSEKAASFSDCQIELFLLVAWAQPYC